MKLSIGIVGLPNVGKSTLFKFLTTQEITIANYPFATIDPNVGVVPVPDERLDKLSEMSNSAKKIPAVVEFYDIAGLVKGANKGEGLGNQFLSHIRDTQAIVMVLRAFGGSEIIHVEGEPDPIRDMEIINMELVLKDLETVEKRLSKVESEARSGSKEAKQALDTLTRLKTDLEEGKPALSYRDEAVVKDLHLLTTKRRLFLLNGKEEDVSDELIEKIESDGSQYIIVNLHDPETDVVESLIKKAYSILGLISFFTTGEEETRAWTIRRGAKAPEAAGAIHTDFQNKFIRAEVIGTEKLLEAGSWNTARQKGWIRLEGKEYEVEDGDVMVIRHG